MRKVRSYQSAFTLIEMILTLVVGGYWSWVLQALLS